MKSTLPLCAVGLAWMATPAALSAQTSLYESFDYSSFNSFDSGSFAGTVTTDAGLTINLAGIYTPSGSGRAATGSIDFTNPAYPELGGTFETLTSNAFNLPTGTVPSVTYQVTFDQPLPTGSRIAIIDIDSDTPGEYGRIYGLGDNAFIETLSRNSSPVLNPPDVSYDTGTSSWLLLAEDGNDSEFNYFDASGISSFTYVGGFYAPNGVSNSTHTNSVAVMVPVPEPAAILLGSLGLLGILRRRR